MGNLMNLAVASTYATGRQDLFAFFNGGLRESVSYDRAAGYFASTLYDAARIALSDFASRSGKIRLICSPFLTENDFQDLEAGVSVRETVSASLVRDVQALSSHPETASALSFLGHLVASGVLDVRICYPSDLRRGLFHSKIGIFRDELDSEVGFIGSANETWRAWSELGNHESFMAFASWSGPQDALRVADLRNYFSDLWEGLIPGLVVREIPDAPRDHLITKAAGSADEVREQIAALLGRHDPSSRRSNHAPKQLQPHQEAVLQSWKQNGCRGMVTHVTGAGKTITAIAAIRDWIASGRPALVLVPRELLQQQWRAELKTELADLQPLILSVGGQLGPARVWMAGLTDQTACAPDLGPRITVAITASASSEAFLRLIRPGEHLLVVGDEVHGLGSYGAQGLLERLQSTDARLGLSATWRRLHDGDGTQRLQEFFGEPLKPDFTIADAIAAGRLVPYSYNIELTTLGDDEEALYQELTEKISRAAGRSVGQDDSLSDALKMLLIRRARVLKNARMKVQQAADIVFQNYVRGQHWLLYCDNQAQVRDLLLELTDEGIYALEYHSAMSGDRDATLAAFVSEGGVLVAIKCLDEGVDLPVLDHAVILASSTNPREYVQRRGRVLRFRPGKAIARIWDMVVVDSSEAPVSAQEIVRAAAFAKDAYNRDVAGQIDDLVTAAKIAGRIDVDFDIEADDDEQD